MSLASLDRPWREVREEFIALKHGAGGRAMRRLISEVLARGFEEFSWDGYGLDAMDDGAALRLGDEWLVITTDSHVVHPLFFPGGDIGRLAIAGTVNDLAVMGVTRPLALTSAMVIEEGFPRADLARVQESMRQTCLEVGVPIVTGDTKVMGRGELDGLVINTTGVGLTRFLVRDAGLRPGDQIIVTGTIGDHGMALMAVRHRLDLDGELVSDVAPVNLLIAQALEAAEGGITAMKDATRGGVASALHEMATKSGVSIVIQESALPVTRGVKAASEMLGLDLLHVANEGKVLIGVAPAVVSRVLDALRRHPLGRQAAIIGECFAEHPGRLVLDTGLGRRLVTELEGVPLPRIC